MRVSTKKQSHKSAEKRRDDSEVRYSILKLLGQGDGYTSEGLAETLYTDEKKIKKALATLRADGFVKTIQDEDRTYYLDRYYLEKIQVELAEEISSQIDGEDLSYIR